VLSDPGDIEEIGPRPAAADPRARRHLAFQAVVRIVAATVLVVVAYFAAPVGQDADALGIAVLVGGSIGLVAVIVLQVRAIIDSPVPQLRAAEALASIAVLVIVLFAFIFVCMSASDASSFSEPITKVNGLYFTVTVLATVGFGDITAESDAARVVVTGQMLLDLLFLGLVVRLLFGASKIGLERRRREAAAAVAADEPTDPAPS
jgi:hypothetical protein